MIFKIFNIILFKFTFYSFRGKKNLSIVIQEPTGVHIHISLFIKSVISNLFVQAVLGGQQLRKARTTVVTKTDLITQFLRQFFVFLFYSKKVTMPGSWFPAAGFSYTETVIYIFVHDCYPSPMAEMKRNLEVLMLCNAGVFIPAHSSAKEFQQNLNSRLVFLAIYFLMCKKETSSKDSTVFTKTSSFF